MKYLGKITDGKDLVTKEYTDGKVAAEAPASASVSSAGVMSFANVGGTTLFTVQLPLYNGGVS